jgi:hypothetical protein
MINNYSVRAFNLCDYDPIKASECQCKADKYKEVLNYLNDKYENM